MGLRTISTCRRRMRSVSSIDARIRRARFGGARMVVPLHRLDDRFLTGRSSSRSRQHAARSSPAVFPRDQSCVAGSPAHQFAPQRVGGLAAPLVLLRVGVGHAPKIVVRGFCFGSTIAGRSATSSCRSEEVPSRITGPLIGLSLAGATIRLAIRAASCYWPSEPFRRMLPAEEFARNSRPFSRPGAPSGRRPNGRFE